MVEQDTIRLLRECDAGIRMGMDSIANVVEHVKSQELRRCLVQCRDAHQQLEAEIRTLLQRYQDKGKAPDPVVKSMAHLKTAAKRGINDSDETIASLMTDGCNMGVKSLSRYLNQYQAADEQSKDIAKRLIALEEQLVVDIRSFL